MNLIAAHIYPLFVCKNPTTQATQPTQSTMNALHLILLLVATLALSTTALDSSAKDSALLSNTQKKALRLGKSVKSIDTFNFLEGRNKISLPMASHDELIKTIRSHPDWFVHAVLAKKHVIIKLPLGLKVGATATKLLHSFIQTEAATKNEDGLWEGTEQHAVGWKSLSHEHKMAIRTIPTTMTIKTEATTDPKTCGNGNYIKSVKLSEEDKTTVNVIPVCGECADGCKKCFGADVSISVSIFCFSVVLVFPRYTGIHILTKLIFLPLFFSFFFFSYLFFFLSFFFFLSQLRWIIARSVLLKVEKNDFSYG